MNESDFSRLKRVLSAPSDLDHYGNKRAFGFYWTRKNIDLISRMVAEFSVQNGVILDPFLGSGTSALGAALAHNSSLFVGVELNEMPIQNLMATLGVDREEIIQATQEARSVINHLYRNYVFQINGREFLLHKIIHDLVNGQLAPVEFIGSIGKAKTTVNHSHSDYEDLRSAYAKRTASTEVKIDAELDANSRIAIKPGMKVSGVFGPLGYSTLLTLRGYASSNPAVRLILGASLHLCRLTDAKSQSQFPFWYPKQQIHEKSVYEIALKKLSELEETLKAPFLDGDVNVVSKFSEWSPGSDEAMFLIHGDTLSALQREVPENSVDLVITDPPYFDQVAYSEYLKLWEFFTGYKSNLENEIVESSRVGSEKTREIFLKDLTAAFVQVRRVMKPQARALVYFKDSKPKNLHDFIAALETVGLKFETQVHQGKSTFTYKQNTSQETSVGGDSIMVFVAEEVEETGTLGNANHDGSKRNLQELDSQFVSLLRDYLIRFGPTSLTEALDNSLIQKLYPTGYLALIKSGSHLVSLAKDNFDYDSENRKWSIRNE